MRVENLKKQESVVESVLFTMGQSVEIRQLAAALESDEETAIQAVERLKEKYDKRKAGIVATEKAMQYQKLICQSLEETEDRLTSGISPQDLAVFFRVINQMIRNMS